MIATLVDGSAESRHTIVLAHGAGSPMQSTFMNRIARALGDRGMRVVRFNFAYMEAGKRVPDREPVLLQRWRDVIVQLGEAADLIIGGKSMGGRMASMVADEVGARGLLCFGYPFHPPGRPEKLRTGHLVTLHTPALIVQGERDQFGTRAEVEQYKLAGSIQIHWIAGADHSLNPAAKSAETLTKNMQDVADATMKFVGRLS